MSPVAASPSGRTYGPCWPCFALAFALLAAVVWSFAYLAVDWRQLFSDESMRLMAKFIGEFFPPDLSVGFVAKAAWGALQTFAVAAIGTLLAVGAASLLALPAAGRFGLAPRLAARLALNMLRSVPELVWAALMVIAAGLGQLMDQSMKMLNGGEASTILLTFLLLVVLADAASAVIRKVLR